MVAEHEVSVRRACEAIGLTRSAFYAPRRPKDDGPVIAAIERYVQENPAHGFDKLHPALKPQGFGKTVLYRVYRALRLNQKRRGKRRLPARVKVPLLIPAAPNEVWSADFMADALWSGRRFADGIDEFLEDDLLWSARKHELGEPAPMSGIPSGSPRVANIVAQQEGFEALLSGGDVALALLPGTYDVTKRFLLGRRDVHRAGADAQCEGEIASIAPIGLDAFAGTLRDQRGRSNQAPLTLGAKITLEPEAAGAGLVDEL